MKFLGLDFAPLDIPLQRRLQTATVFYFSISFFIHSFGGTFLIFYLLFTPYYFLSLIYLTWLYYDWNIAREGGRKIQFVRNSNLWRYFASYFPIKLVKTVDLDVDKNYIFGSHPHGIIAMGSLVNFGTEATGFGTMFPGLKPRMLTLDGNFHVPIHRECFLSLGTCSVSKESITWLLSKEGVGNAVIIVVGGAEEALDARPGTNILTIKNRKGFVRMAITHGASLVPVYSFGENNIFRQVSNPAGSILRTIQEQMKSTIGVSSPLFSGRGIFNYTFGFLPHRKPIVTVVGKPMDVKRNANPTKEEVDQVHNEYLQQLKKLYDEHKEQYGDPEQELIFH